MLRRQKEGLTDVSLHNFLQIDETLIEGEEPLYNELRSFCQAVLNGSPPEVAGEDGLKALTLAVEIQRLVEKNPVR
jgi:predicted dehydrogenase